MPTLQRNLFMESTTLTQSNLNNVHNTENNTQGPLHFIEIRKAENKSIKIPCANEKIAKQVASGFQRLKTASTISLLRN